MLERDFAEAVKPSGLGEVPGAQVALEDDGPAGLAQLADAGDPL